MALKITLFVENNEIENGFNEKGTYTLEGKLPKGSGNTLETKEGDKITHYRVIKTTHPKNSKPQIYVAEIATTKIKKEDS